MRKSLDETISLAIQKTLTYRAIFSYPLSKYQLYHFLLIDKHVPFDLFEKNLKRLIEKKVVKTRHKTYYLTGTKTINSGERKSLTKQLLAKSQQNLNILASVPWIKLLAVSGSAAAYNCADDADLDLFIITAPNRIWLTRFFVTLLQKITGSFPRVDGERGKICSNYFLDTTKLELAREDRNVYTAHEIALLQPVFQREDCYFKFLLANDWLFDVFGNFHVNFPHNFGKSKKIDSFIFDLLERIVRTIQKHHMKRKITTEIIENHKIHFRKHDNSQKILAEFKKHY